MYEHSTIFKEQFVDYINMYRGGWSSGDHGHGSKSNTESYPST